MPAQHARNLDCHSETETPPGWLGARRTLRLAVPHRDRALAGRATPAARAADEPGVSAPPASTPAAEPEEAALVARVQRGDPAAFDTLTRRYARRAYVVAYRVLRHPQDAEDLVQDAFIAALEAISGFDLARPFAPWFLRIVVNRALNARKSRAARERRIAPCEPRADDAQATASEAWAERAEIRARFRAALQRLSTRQRLIVQLADLEGYSSVEIGEMLSLASGTVRWHLHQARAVLRRALAPLVADGA